MKKIIIRSAAIILLLLISFYGYFEFRKYKSYQSAIHKDAALLIKIDADKIYSTLVADYINHPSYLQKKRKINSGLTIPSNIFIYNVKSKSSQTYFSALQIADQKSMLAFVKDYLKITDLKSTTKGITYGSSKNQSFTIAFNHQTLAIAYTLKKETVMDILTDILDQKNLLQKDDPALIALKNLSAHLAYYYKGYTGTASFTDGLIHAKGDFNFESLAVKGSVFHHRTFNQAAVIKMWLHAELTTPVISKTIQVKDDILQSDSLLKYYKGYVDLELINVTSQQDSSVTYTYNEDFEKEAVVTVKNVKVPELSSLFKGNSTPLVTYLNSQHVLQANGTVNKDWFPLYTLYQKNTTELMQFSTSKNAYLPELNETSDSFFKLEIDFDQLRKREQFPWLNPYINLLKSLKATAKPVSREKNHFEVSIDFSLKKVNALNQLF